MGAKMGKMLKQTGPKIDPTGKNGKADKCDKNGNIGKTGGNGKPDRARKC